MPSAFTVGFSERCRYCLVIRLNQLGLIVAMVIHLFNSDRFLPSKEAGTSHFLGRDLDVVHGGVTAGK